MTMKLQLFLFGFLCCVMGMAHSDSIEFTDCSAEGYKVEKVDISPCSEQPCKFPSGSNVTVRVNYKVEDNGECQPALKSNITVYPRAVDADNIALVALDYPLPDNNACHFLNPTCPLCPGNTTEFYDTITIYSWFPKISTTVKGKKVNEENKVVFCFTFLADIVDAEE